jgi:pyruvate/2-oxoacid:ferredoxin oxidoreductase beta subunit
MGIPITVIFVNNAIYGMTGGQLAPTSLVGQTTATTPAGRPLWMGQPLKVAELIAGLDGPIYVERVALYDNKQRLRAKKAIKKAVQLQVEDRGFAFVEVLAECPTHLGLNPMEAESWVREDDAGLPARRRRTSPRSRSTRRPARASTKTSSCTRSRPRRAPLRGSLRAFPRISIQRTCRSSSRGAAATARRRPRC